jgi:hypothetical protein
VYVIVCIPYHIPVRSNSYIYNYLYTFWVDQQESNQSIQKLKSP